MKAVDLQVVHQRQKIVRTRPRLRARWIDHGTSEPSPVVRHNAVASRRKGGKLVSHTRLLPVAACTNTTGTPPPPVSVYQRRTPGSCADVSRPGDGACADVERQGVLLSTSSKAATTPRHMSQRSLWRMSILHIKWARTTFSLSSIPKPGRSGTRIAPFSNRSAGFRMSCRHSTSPHWNSSSRKFLSTAQT